MVIDQRIALDQKIPQHGGPDRTVYNCIKRKIGTLPEQQAGKNKKKSRPHAGHEGKLRNQRRQPQKHDASQQDAERCALRPSTFPLLQGEEEGQCNAPYLQNAAGIQNSRGPVHPSLPPTYAVSAVRNALRLRRLISSSVSPTRTVSRRSSVTCRRLTRYQWLQRTKL